MTNGLVSDSDKFKIIIKLRAKGACTYYITLMGWGGFRFCYTVLNMVGSGFDFCYITLLKFLTYVIV